MPVLHSYIVAHDSGFAPNPFYGFCTLATCKPEIRKHAAIGDWILGTGSNRKGVRRGGFIVYAMRVQQAMTFAEYWHDPRFTNKKPNLYGSYRMACGDNIYRPDSARSCYEQLNSYHSQEDGSPNQKHVNRDTSVDRVLISQEFVYFGAEGPKLPSTLMNAGLVIRSRGRLKITDPIKIRAFEAWFEGLELHGYQGKPFDLLEEERERK